MTNTTEEPCKECGSAVRLRRETLPGSLAEPKGEQVDVRVCTNADCDTNHRERRTLAMEV
jgi:hypothetical protein